MASGEGAGVHTYWKQLLALSTNASNEGGETDSSSQGDVKPSAMDEDNRAWLESVMSELVDETDIFRKMQRLLAALHGYADKVESLDEDDEESIKFLCYELDDLLSVADLTPAFVQQGGLDILATFTSDKVSEDLREAFVKTIPTLCGNNPPAQLEVLNRELLAKLMNYLKESNGSEDFRCYVLSAVASIVKGSEYVYNAFRTSDGPQLLDRIIKSPDSSISYAARAARTVAVLAYNFLDNDKYRNMVIPYLCKAYYEVAKRDLNGDFDTIIEYVRVFLIDHVTDDDYRKVELHIREELLRVLNWQRKSSFFVDDEAERVEKFIYRLENVWNGVSQTAP